MHEIPPNRAKAAEKAFNKFLDLYLPNFVDSPYSLPAAIIGLDTGSYGFDDLDTAAQQVLGVPYVSLMHMITFAMGPSKPPLEKFRNYLDTVVEKIDLLSLKEAQITRYVFAPTGPLDVLNVTHS